ncbi:translation initiation factor IF-2 subunit alpha [Vulcanisaeta distributa]|uniref:Translation initiation factor 2, alpha subunit n=1 Tax=Vulcanisaeta distributa (strain DSM 14429 / JCM 11212 / NBRC 100878 / IC-017) TaxID=572478 RepID=E1QPE5_VULDI|nr:translation initiation factor IF-2 subunit alpha [Vulcanisaeta distributa]ADN51433.1 translation initiation factor 2, alpha subunit [Vulcanisaeta distributa DSM 14429]
MSKKEEKVDDIRKNVLPVRIARKELPDIGELVIGTVYRILEHGAYVLLDEYGGIEAYAPINEIVQSWFHDIKDYLRLGQKTVFRVIRVDARRRLIDVSLRKVKEEEKKEKLTKWKRTLRGVRLLELVAKKLNIPLDKALQDFGWKLEDYYGDFLSIFENVAKYGPDDLRKLGLSDNVINAIAEIARERVEVEPVEISGIIRMISIKPDGVKHVRDVLLKAMELARKEGAEDVRIYTIGPPRYRIDLVGKDPKKLEQVLKDVVNLVTTEIRKRGGEASFTRIGE